MMNIDKQKLKKEMLGLFPNGKEISVGERDNQKGTFWFLFEFTCFIEEKEIAIQIGLPEHFPLKLPHFFLKDPTQLGFIPHLEKSGYICYTFETGLFLDIESPIEIIKESWGHTRQTLKDGLLRNNKDDLYKDFEILWKRQNNILYIDSLIEPNNKLQKVTVLEDAKKTKKVLLNHKSEEQLEMINSFYGSDIITKGNKYKGIYVPMRRGTRIMPPSYEGFWNLKTLRSYIYRNITGSIKKQLDGYLKNITVKTTEKAFLFFSIPLGSEVIFVGVYFLSKKRKGGIEEVTHPLKKNKHSFIINPVSIKRHNKSYLLKRTVGNTDVTSKSIAVIGLGSLGSPIAFELAKVGVESLLLIDNDLFDVDNVYRHSLGSDMLYHNIESYGYSGISKVEAMTMKLRTMYPTLKVDYECEDLLNIMNDSFHLLKERDLIIVAIGEPTLELYINERIYREEKTPPVIYTWIEPMGIGGHSLLTNHNDRTGCLQCLFTSPLEEKTLVYNRSSFIQEDQQVSKTMLGCGSTFTPYGSIDAVQTALLSTRLAIQTLTNKVDKNALKSWKGSNEEVSATGLKTSRRFSFSTEELFNREYEYKTINCPVCKGGSICSG